MIKALIVYHLMASLITGAALFVQYQKITDRVVERSILLLIAQQCLLALIAILFPIDGFGRIQLMAWGIFLYFPLILIGKIFLLWKSKKTYSIFLIVVLFLTLLIMVDAFVVEPNSLVVTRINLESDKIAEPVRVALLADIQTDQPGSREEKVLRQVKAEDPDLVLLAGDYLQISDPERYQRAISDLNRIFVEADLRAPLGVIAVRGNVDWNVWPEIFKDLNVLIVEETRTIDLGQIRITGVNLLESENPNLELVGSDKYHIVLGHSPNYSLGEIEADILLAGHTHGGQVQLPGLGPLLTLSAVPRNWASGLTEIQPGQFLLVSRGIGLERGNAPRLRFLCRPELIILDLLPALNTSD